ncbi:MAG: hypothetical protein HA496_04355 [Thaumarchaeota archaeon]|nr:hypothetical protein [Nitrososphaerota archaeon]
MAEYMLDKYVEPPRLRIGQRFLTINTPGIHQALQRREAFEGGRRG